MLARPLKTPNARIVVSDFTVLRRPQANWPRMSQTCVYPILSARKANIPTSQAIVSVIPYVSLAPMDVTKV